MPDVPNPNAKVTNFGMYGQQSTGKAKQDDWDSVSDFNVLIDKVFDVTQIKVLLPDAIGGIRTTPVFTEPYSKEQLRIVLYKEATRLEKRLPEYAAEMRDSVAAGNIFVWAFRGQAAPSDVLSWWANNRDLCREC